MINAENEDLPNMEIAQLRFLLNKEDGNEKEKEVIWAKLIGLIRANNMAPLYKNLCFYTKRLVDQTFLEAMQETNKQVIKDLEFKLEDAENNLGENEIREARLAIAMYYVKICDKEMAIESFKKLFENKVISIGQKMDIYFAQIHLGLLLGDYDLFSQNIEKSQLLINNNLDGEKSNSSDKSDTRTRNSNNSNDNKSNKGDGGSGGDWERKNKLKVYEGIQMLLKRNFEGASCRFLDIVATFSCYELFDFRSFAKYTIISSIICLPRVDLKKKIIESPELRSISQELPDLFDLVNHLYNCNYHSFFRALDRTCKLMDCDWLLGQHQIYFCREMRIIAYKQLLQSYSSVKMSVMADLFGISMEFLDMELSNFISKGRLNCKIDKVSEIIEAIRPSQKNHLFQKTLKDGDILLNRIQHLSRVVEL